jgi:hypothetical protein
MTALPLSRQRIGSPHGPTFRERLDENVEHFRLLWLSTPIQPPPRPRERAGSTPRRRAANAERCRALIVDIASRVEAYPADPAARARWRRELQELVRRFGARHLGWPAGYRDLPVADEYWGSTVDFVRRARAFAPQISPADLFQALRNVWIVNSIQLLLDREVRCGVGPFAYSMLYPWTDNLLDDPRVDAGLKQSFNRRLERRLLGHPVRPAGRREREVFELIRRIEESRPREHWPRLYSSLLAIHHGQTESLAQQTGPPGCGRTLEISLRKGGSSVLPDAYLVQADLPPAVERFVFGYGVLLQLLDDLQDVSSDLDAGHETVFTRAARDGMLDAPTARLWRFVDLCLDAPGPFAGSAHDDRRDLLRRNCAALLIAAVAAERRRFTPRFLASLEPHSPVGLRATGSLGRFAERRLRAAAERLSRRYAPADPLELLCCAEPEPDAGSPSARPEASPPAPRDRLASQSMTPV